MTTFTEGVHFSEGLLSEANGTRSRDMITIVSGSGVIAPMTVLGKITASGKYGPSTNAAADPATGVETGVAVCLEGCDATSGDVKVRAVLRDCEVKKGYLKYHSSVDNDTKKTSKNNQLAAVGIIAR